MEPESLRTRMNKAVDLRSMQALAEQIIKRSRPRVTTFHMIGDAMLILQ